MLSLPAITNTTTVAGILGNIPADKLFMFVDPIIRNFGTGLTYSRFQMLESTVPVVKCSTMSRFGFEIAADVSKFNKPGTFAVIRMNHAIANPEFMRVQIHWCFDNLNKLPYLKVTSVIDDHPELLAALNQSLGEIFEEGEYHNAAMEVARVIDDDHEFDRIMRECINYLQH